MKKLEEIIGRIQVNLEESCDWAFETCRANYIKYNTSITKLKQFCLSPIFVALLLPIIIGLFFPESLFDKLWIILLWAIPVVSILLMILDYHINEKPIVASILERLVFLPAGWAYKSDLKVKSLPVAVISIIIVNITAFLFISENIADELKFFPYGEPSWFQILISFVTSAFLHADIHHLAGNMIFFWVFGVILEPRLGTKRLLLVYFLCIITSKIFTLVLLSLEILITDSPDTFMEYHSLGASGAIAGLIGIFAVRCFFARIYFSFPLFIFPFLSIPIRVQGMIFIGLYFFAFQILGSKNQFTNELGEVNYWAHVGGYFGGFALGYLMKFNIAAKNEELAVKAKRLSEDSLNRPETKKMYEDVLKEDPKNEEALSFLLHNNRYNKKKRTEYYKRLMPLYLSQDFQKSETLFYKYFPDHVDLWPVKMLTKFGIYYYTESRLYEAKFCLNLAIKEDHPMKEKALLFLGKAYGCEGNHKLAKEKFKEVINNSSDPDFQEEAKRLFATELHEVRSRANASST